jgi:mannose-1-phosphate guanylyltransferase
LKPFVAVIMAGGKGQRFWPLSTPERPKQFLDLSHTGRTLIQATYDRVVKLAGDPDHVLVATGRRYVNLVREQLPMVPAVNLLIEPEGRDSAPAVALAALTVHARYGDVIMGLFSSDHEISDDDAFEATLRSAIDLAEERDGLVTIGIRPSRASTGYGYIEKGAPAGCGFEVKRFVEKPNLRTAEAYSASGDYVWNAGIFVWSTGAILEELDRHAPELMQPLRRAFHESEIGKVFPGLTKISIDFAVMERTDRAYVVPGEFDWDDIGDWVALERLLRQHTDEEGVEATGTNTVVGRHVGMDTSGNIIYTEDPDDVVVTLGVEDLVVVKRGNTVLLVRKDRVQDIKTLLQDARLAELIEG